MKTWHVFIIFGAGAKKKDSGGPLTNELLHEAFQAGPSLVAQQNAIQLLQQFLQENFPVNRVNSEEYSSLPLLLSLIDTACAAHLVTARACYVVLPRAAKAERE